MAGKDMVVEWKEKVPYCRVLAKVVQGGVNVNLQMVKEGPAWHYSNYSKSIELSMDEAEGKAGKKSCWANPNSVPLWKFRNLDKK